jgi:hypothetical protein
MTWDNRYFPWFDHFYNASDSRHGYIDFSPFFLTSHSAFRYEMRASKDDQLISIPELFGEVDLVEISKSIVKAGQPNPLPDDWLWLSEFRVKTPSSLEAQGFTLKGYAPITKHFGVGGSMLMQKLNTFVSVIPDESSTEKLFLTTPGNQALFTQTLQKIYKAIDIKSTSQQTIGIGDIVVYANIHDTHEYKYKFKKLDWGVLAGFIIPSGIPKDPYSLASLPFGSEYKAWGWFIAPRIEFEIRDDMKAGFQARVVKRFDTCVNNRIPLGKENTLFAPLVGNVGVNQGSTFGFCGYFVFEDIQAGFGVQLQYTLTVHEHDFLKASLPNLTAQPNFINTNYYSGWTQEYLTVKLLYDIAYDKDWKYKPLAYFSWDIPMNHLAGRGFAQTQKISLGCNINF